MRSVPELAAALDTHQTGGAFCFVVTPRLHEAAQAQGITSIGFEDETLHLIAEHMQYIEPGEPLPPLAFLGRLAGKAAIEKTDIHWERGVAQEHQFYSAGSLANPEGFACEEVIRHCRSLGILKMHQMPINLDPGVSHIEEVARAFAVGGRSIGTQFVGGFLPDGLRGVLLRRLKTLEQKDLPDPIVITRSA